jgi:outer membrane immunogenic protein
MRTTILAYVLVLGAATAESFAADIPLKAPRPAPVYNWAGFYAGVNGGYGWADPSADFTPATVPLPPNVVLVGPAAPFTLNTSPKGYVIGGQFGYNWQFGRVVAGVEGDFDYAHLKDSAARDFTNTTLVFGEVPGFTAGKASLESRLDWFGTLRGRLGFAFDRLLPYLTAGGAVAHMKSTAVVSGFNVVANGNVFGPFSNAVTVSDTRWGLALGGGLDWALTAGWVLRGEYLLMHFQSGKTYGALIPGLASLRPEMDNVHLARLALSYRFTP